MDNYVVINKTKLFFVYFLIGVVVLLDDSYWFSTSGITLLSTLKNVVYVLLPIALLFAFRFKVRPSSRQVLVLLFTVVIIVLSSLVNGNSFIGGPLLLICLIVSGLLISNNIDIVQFSKCFIDIIFYISIYSLLISLLLLVGVLSPSVIYNIADVPTFTFGGCVYFPTWIVDGLYRNCGIFREPGIFQVYLNIALLLQLFVLKAADKKKVIVFAVGVLSTFSTAGIIILVFILVLFLFSAYKTKNSFLYGASLIIIVLYVFNSSLFREESFNKLEYGLDSKSTLARVSSITVPAEIFMESPIFGRGMSDYSDEYERILYKQYRTPYGAEGLSTNTIMTVLGVWGIFIGAYYLLGLLLFSKTICHRDRSKSFLVFIAILMMISNEAIVYSLLLQIMIMYGYASSPIAYSQT